MLYNMSYWALELHGFVATWPSETKLYGSLKLSCKALLKLSCTALLNLSYMALLKLSYISLELHVS